MEGLITDETAFKNNFHDFFEFHNHFFVICFGFLFLRHVENQQNYHLIYVLEEIQIVNMKA